MSSNNPESQGQNWPIYPGVPRSAEPGRPSSEPPYRISEPGRPSSEPPYRISEPGRPFSEPVEEPRPFSEPGRPFSEPGRPSSEPVEEKYADPTPRDDAYRAYQSYLHQPTDHRHLGGRSPEPVEGQRRRTTSSNALQKKYVWIAIGIVAALVITSIARGGFNLWPLIIFGVIAWWVVGNKKKC